MAGISSPGIGSNLDINSIITKLMQAEASAPSLALTRKEASYQAKLSAFGNLSSALGAFQTALSSLNTQSTFQSVNATPSDASIFTATATAKATAGSYNVNITQLAQAQTIASAGQASTTATIGGGSTTTLTFQFGTVTGGKLQNGQYVNDPTATPPDPAFTQDPNKTSGTVTIDSTNNSLQGIRDAINKANLGVTATIVSDGSATPHHLVIKSNETGATSNMKISVAGSETALSDLLAYDPAGTQNMTQSAAGQSAVLTVNGIAVTSQSNIINGAIEGVTLTAAKVGSSSLSIARNTSAVQSSVTAFVKAYNDVNSTIKKLTAYNEDRTLSGPLIGDSSVRNIEAQLRKMMSSPLTGSSGSLTTLSQAGISIDQKGVMSLDATKLSTAMSKNMDDVTALFSSIGKTTDSLVSYVSSTSATSPGTNEVVVSQLATQGKLIGSLVIGGSTAINAGNKDMTVTVNGVTSSVSLVEGTYTPAQLAAQLQSAINGISAFSSKGIAVSATIDASGKLSLTSNTFGSTSKVSLSGNAASVLVGASPAATDGVDVAGTIGGIAAGGSGQFLTGAAGSTAAGLKLQITGGATGSRGTVNFSQGYAFHLTNLLDEFVNSKDGMISGRTKSLQDGITNVSKEREKLDARLTEIEARYRKQFTALDVMISKLNSTSSYLTQQLEQISNLSQS
ncbi:flagellar hook protein FliD [Noviherbaspirillum cavernae]|uniref:Flagellar hook-associated protein 2 n=1 Tax=Noviherbaspirillum cavernae TaxID=2320862 RepID=A0A418X0G4_9BURK|nr:flagellar filament capping protein FliD [Noviherbaspirillum cavernae]RJG05966.1 flagellar hook protein FliD [Noviherbaspirillum cavernae]